MITKTKAEMLAYYAGKAVQAQAEYDRMKAVLDLLPDLAYEFVHTHGYRADFSIKLEAEDLDGVRTLLGHFPPIPLVRLSNGCTSFVPADTKAKGEALPVFPVTLKCGHLSSPEMQADWYADIGGKRFQIHVKVKKAWEYVSWSGTKRMSGGEAYWANETFRHFFAKAKVVSWAKGSGEYMGDYTLYFPAESCLTFDDATERASAPVVIMRR